MRVALITGACGFVGRNLTKHLLSQGYRVVAVDCVDHAPFDSENVEYIKSDLSSVTEFPSINVQCDVLYHLAWIGVNPEARSDIQIQKRNIDLCINAVELAKRFSISKIIFIGSTMEYCYNTSEISDASLPTPQNFYGSMKIATRYICTELARSYGIEFEYAIITSIYGPGREDNNVIYYSMKKLLAGESPELTECIQKWDFVHILDAVEALRLIGEKGKPFATYAIGTGENMPLRNSIDLISSLINKDIPIKFGAVPYKNGQIAHSAIDIGRLVSDTGYTPKYNFTKGITEVIDFYRKK